MKIILIFASWNSLTHLADYEEGNITDSGIKLIITDQSVFVCDFVLNFNVRFPIKLSFVTGHTVTTVPNEIRVKHANVCWSKVSLTCVTVFQCKTTMMTCGGTVWAPLIVDQLSAAYRVMSQVFPLRRAGQAHRDTQALTFTPWRLLLYGNSILLSAIEGRIKR